MNCSTLTMDFGTSNSLVSAVINGKSFPALPLDPTSIDPTIIRTLLYFPNENKAYYGQDAINAYEEFCFEGRFIKSIKKFLPTESYLGSHIGNRIVRLEDLIKFFLLEMKKRAEKHLNHKFDNILLGRPVKYSHDSAKDKIALFRMTKAAELAGFKKIEFLPEPIAAAHDFSSDFDQEKLVLVTDLGGGTSDFTIVKMNKELFSPDDVLAVTGVPIAGDKYDGSIMQYSLAKHLGSKVTYRAPLGQNILQMPSALLKYICSPGDLTQLHKNNFYQFFKDLKNWSISSEDKKKLELLEVIVDDNLGFKLFEAIEKCKIEVNTKEKVEFNYKYTDLVISERIQRNEFEKYSDKYTQLILNELNNCLNMAQITSEEIDYIYCTGGTSKLRAIQSGLQTLFPNEKLQTGNTFSSVLLGLNKFVLKNL